MAKTSEMKLLELMILKEDISSVLEYLGKKGTIQFQTKLKDSKNSSEENGSEFSNADAQVFNELKKAYGELNYPAFDKDLSLFSSPKEEDRQSAAQFISSYKDLDKRISDASENLAKAAEAYKETESFADLKLSYSELEHLSFLSLKIGKILPDSFDELKDALDGIAVVVPLGNDRSRVLVASSKKGRFAIESELKNCGFVQMEIPKDFKGVPDDILESLKKTETGSRKTGSRTCR